MQTMTVSQFHESLRAQGVARREDIAFTCSSCGTVQSAQSLINAGAGETFEDVERFLGFSCVGRWTNAGPHKDGTPPGSGCDWTLGGLFKFHPIEVIDEATATQQAEDKDLESRITFAHSNIEIGSHNAQRPPRSQEPLPSGGCRWHLALKRHSLGKDRQTPDGGLYDRHHPHRRGQPMPWAP